MPHDGRALSVEDITSLADLTAAAIVKVDATKFTIAS